MGRDFKPQLGLGFGEKGEPNRRGKLGTFPKPKGT